VAYLGFGKEGGHGERAESEPITGGVQGQSPWSEGQRGKAPWSWNTFCFWMFNENRKFAHFSEIWKRKRSSKVVEFCNSCWKMAKKRTFSYKIACKKFSWSGQRGGASHCGPPPKHATASYPPSLEGPGWGGLNISTVGVRLKLWCKRVVHTTAMNCSWPLVAVLGPAWGHIPPSNFALDPLLRGHPWSFANTTQIYDILRF